MLHIRSLGSVKIQSVDYNALLEKLRTLAGSIRKQCPEAEKILLFGSFAKKNYTPESDVDILITVTYTDLPFIQRRDAFIDFFTSIPFDINLHVYTKDETQKMLRDNNAFLKDAMEEAVEL